MNSEIAPAPHFAAKLFRWCFRQWRPRGYMRLGQLLTRVVPQSRYVPISFVDGPLWVDLRSIDHQPMFLNDDYTYEPYERRLLSVLLRPGQVAMDVGANLGAYARTMAQAVGEYGLVLAYDPRADLVMRNSQGLRQLLVRPFGVSDRDGGALFRDERASTMSHLVQIKDRRAADVEIVTVSLDAEFARLRLQTIDLLKVDVEGFEEDVFRGAARLLTGSRPPIVMFEWQPNFRSHWKEGPIAVLARIAGSSWVVMHFDSDGIANEMDGWVETEKAVTVVGFPPQRHDALQAFKEHVSQKARANLAAR